MEKEEGAAAATTAPGEDFHNEFYNTGRMGRRNALPDILGNHAATTTADLPAALDALTTQGMYCRWLDHKDNFLKQ
jgi:cAMP-dependent protein kinase inhibitor